MFRIFNSFNSFWRVLFGDHDEDVFTPVVRVVNKSKHRLPEYETIGAAGMDLKANIDGPLKLEAHSSVIVPTGIFIALPEGFECQVRGRSGLAFKYDIVAHVGTIN